jgi:hypothetical protein
MDDLDNWDDEDWDDEEDDEEDDEDDFKGKYFFFDDDIDKKP